MKRRTIHWVGISGCLLAVTACAEDPNHARRVDMTAVDTTSSTEGDSGGDVTKGDSGSDGGTSIAEGGVQDSGHSVADDAGSGAKVLLSEGFDDADLEGRGWYDEPGSSLSTTVKKSGAASFECVYAQKASGCTGRGPARHPLDPTESVYLRYDVKYSTNFVGSQKNYHPHEFYLLTTADPQKIGPAMTHLTVYVEQVGGRPQLALQDGLNVDTDCMMLNGDRVTGCNGSFDSYPFTENRSVAACNGIVGKLDGRDCFRYGSGYYSARMWRAGKKTFTDEPGPYFKNDWHRVEAYIQMNSIQNGKAVADGVIRYWFDGELLISADDILLRTGAHPNLKFNQLLVGPYIGDGSPVRQTMWLDDLLVATAKPN